MPMRPVLSADFESHLSQAPFMGVSTLLRKAFAGGDVSELGASLIERAQQHNDLYALLDLSTVLQLHYQREAGLAVLAEALKGQALYRVAQAGSATALRLLVLKAPGDLMSNTPVECLLEEFEITVDVLYVSVDVRTGAGLPAVLPEHDVLLVAVGESDENQALLAHLAESLAAWPRPVLNLPDRVSRLSRQVASARLGDVPGVAMPSTVRVDRESLQQIADGRAGIETFLPGGAFPLILRPVGSHAGNGLVKVEQAAEIEAYLAEHAHSQFYLARFFNYASADGLFRKYRVVLVAGRPFICHMGISQHWMVHYPYEEMIAHASRRGEEQQAMETFNQGMALRHQAAFAMLQQRVGLDYWGMDCAETATGELLIFEVASAMVIHAMDRVDLFPYKQTQMKSVFAAFYRMLEQAAGKVA
jgi:glutathione synthase/RimK-type ligase-like ATP-grasp enzyme